MVSIKGTWNVLVTLFISIAITSRQPTVTCSTIIDAGNLHTALLTGYNKDVRPIANQGEVLNVTVTSFVRSVQNIDEITGELSFTGGILLNWEDVNMQWDPALYGGTGDVYISYESVWVPELVITTTTGTSDTMAKKWQKVNYQSSGHATLVVGGRILASCNLDVEKFPFDSQTCEVRFALWGYESTTVGVIPFTPTIGLTQYSGNTIWDLYKTETKSETIEGWVYFTMVFHFKRNASFTLVSLLTPILFLSFLNVMVFLLIPDSGERVSYSVTVLLAVAVFMTIISDVLPATSDPVPIITYKLMVDMAISALITLVTILNLRLYHKDDSKPVPRRLVSIYRFFQFDCFRKHGQRLRVRKVDSAKDSESIAEKGDVKTDLKKSDVNDGVAPGYNLGDTVSWKDISNMVDYISLVVFSIAYVLSFVVYIGRAMS